VFASLATKTISLLVLPLYRIGGDAFKVVLLAKELHLDGAPHRFAPIPDTRRDKEENRGKPL
jgi:hypothetical protein